MIQRWKVQKDLQVQRWKVQKDLQVFQLDWTLAYFNIHS